MDVVASIRACAQQQRWQHALLLLHENLHRRDPKDLPIAAGANIWAKEMGFGMAIRRACDRQTSGDRVYWFQQQTGAVESSCPEPSQGPFTGGSLLARSKITICEFQWGCPLESTYSVV